MASNTTVQQGNSNGHPNATAGPSSPAKQPNGTTAQAHPNGNSNENGASNSSLSDPKPDNIALQKQAEEELNQLFAARREEELARRDRSLAEFLVMLDGYKPLIPEEVTEYYLQRAGFECADPRLKRLLSLSAQKFVADLSRSAYHFAKLRVNGTAGGRGRPAAGVDRNRVVLTMDDLSLALADRGVNVNKPDYYF